MSDTPSPLSGPTPSLQRKIEGRALRSIVLSSLVWFNAVLISVPLFSVLYMLITRGGARLNMEVFTELPPAGFETGGGFGNALVGTFFMVGIAALIAIPVGILAAIFLAELGPSSKLATIARFSAKTRRKSAISRESPRPAITRAKAANNSWTVTWVDMDGTGAVSDCAVASTLPPLCDAQSPL